MKCFYIFSILFFTASCKGGLYNDEVKKEPNLIPESYIVGTLKKSIIESNSYKGRIIDYIYDCDQFPDVKLDKMFFRNQNITNRSGVYTILDNGIYARASCQISVNIEGNASRQLLLQSCAQSSIISLVDAFFYREKREVEIDYSRWCILKSSNKDIQIEQFVIFKK